MVNPTPVLGELEAMRALPDASAEAGECAREMEEIVHEDRDCARGEQDVPELLEKYEKTRAYRSAPAKKAVRTRQKKAGEGDGTGAPGGDGVGAQPK